MSKKSNFLLAALLFLSTSSKKLFAENPETEASDRNMNTPQPDTVAGAAHKAKDTGNHILNALDHAVHDERAPSKTKPKKNVKKSKTPSTL